MPRGSAMITCSICYNLAPDLAEFFSQPKVSGGLPVEFLSPPYSLCRRLLVYVDSSRAEGRPVVQTLTHSSPARQATEGRQSLMFSWR